MYETNWEGCINIEDDGEDDGDRERERGERERERVRNVSNPTVLIILAAPEKHSMRPVLKRTLGPRGLQQWLCFILGLRLLPTSYELRPNFFQRYCTFDFELYTVSTCKSPPSLKSNQFPQLFHSFNSFTDILWHRQPCDLRNTLKHRSSYIISSPWSASPGSLKPLTWLRKPCNWWIRHLEGWLEYMLENFPRVL